MAASKKGSQKSTDLPTFAIFSDDKELSGSFNVVSIMVSKAVGRIPRARVVFKSGDPATGDFPLSSKKDELLPGRKIRIEAGYHNENTTIFEGIIIRHRLEVKGTNNFYVVVECRDRAYSMTVGRKNRYFRDIKDSEAIEELIGAHTLEADVEPTDVTHRELVQFNTTDWDFMLSRAEANGMVVVVDDGRVVVKKPDTSKDAALKLTFGNEIISLDAVIDATHQQATLRCAAWNQAEQTLLEAEAEQPQIEEAGNLPSTELSGTVTDEEVEYRHTGWITAEELQAWADARKTRAVLSKIRGVVRCKGVAELKCADVVELAGLGERFNGKVFVSGIKHEVGNGRWEMDVEFGLSAEPFISEYEVNSRTMQELLPHVEGLQIGVVTQIQDDPDGEYRVLVKMPVVDAEAEGTWARVATLDAGKNRGAFFMPEIGDEVVLGFLNNDPRDAVILGMLNSSHKPAPLEPKDDNPEKGFVTREGLRLIFNDELKSIRIETPAGNVVQLSEDEGAILMEDENGNRLEMNSSGVLIESGGNIELKASGTIKVEGQNVEGSASTGMKLNGGASAELSSSGATKIKGSIVNIN